MVLIGCGTSDVNSVLDDIASGLAQYLTHVAEPAPGPAEQLGGFGDVHRGIVRHPRDREFELADLVGDGLERFEVRLAPAGPRAELLRIGFRGAGPGGSCGPAV